MDQCKNGGWEAYGSFRNQGDCVSFVATKGKTARRHRLSRPHKPGIDERPPRAGEPPGGFSLVELAVGMADHQLVGIGLSLSLLGGDAAGADQPVSVSGSAYQPRAPA